jgi:hypothetical protein
MSPLQFCSTKGCPITSVGIDIGENSNNVLVLHTTEKQTCTGQLDLFRYLLADIRLITVNKKIG